MENFQKESFPEEPHLYDWATGAGQSDYPQAPLKVIEEKVTENGTFYRILPAEEDKRNTGLGYSGEWFAENHFVPYSKDN